MTLLEAVINAMAIFGTAIFIYVAYSIWDFISLHFSRTAHPLSSYKRKGTEPTYALISGASAGIGLGIAKALIEQGFGVILIGHLADELAETQTTLRREMPDAVVRTVTMDARTASPAEMQAMIKNLEDLQLSILVNNVGGNAIELPAFREQATYTCADVDTVINQNARFMARLTSLALPLLSRRNPDSDERSLVLNLGSLGQIGLPYLIMYGATKAFNIAFSRGLARELSVTSETSHIDSLAILPGEVLSQGNCRGLPSNAPRCDEFGRCIIATVDGAVKRKLRELSPYWKHDLEGRALNWLPEGIRTTELHKVALGKKDAWDRFYAKTQ